MATRLFLRDTQTEPGTTGTPSALGSVVDLLEAQGTEATLGSGNTSSASFVSAKKFILNVGDTVEGTSFPVSIDMASVSASTLEWQAKIQRLDSSNAVQAESDVLGPFNNAGIKTGTLTLSTTWAAGDRLAVALELRKVSGGGNRSFTLNVNDADSHVDATFALAAVTGDLAATESGDALAADGAVSVAGDLAATEAADTLAADGTVPSSGATGDLVATEATDTVAAAGGVLVAGDVAAPEAADVPAAVGAVLVAGDLAATELPDIFVGEGYIVVGGDVVVVESADTFAASAPAGVSVGTGGLTMITELSEVML